MSVAEKPVRDPAFQEYTYSDIDESEIRCIKLGNRGHFHQGEIVTVPRSSPQYLALSYSWGSPVPDPERKIILDGRGYINITENLENALIDLERAALPTKLFFIDQISINQRDNVEKGVQVKHMNEVYTNAQQVITYLGPEEDCDEQAFKLLNDSLSSFSRWFSEGDLSQRFRYLMGGEAPTNTKDTNADNEDRLRHLEKVIFGSQWNSRVWMVQEHVLNKNIVFLKGPRLLDLLKVHGWIVQQATDTRFMNRPYFVTGKACGWRLQTQFATYQKGDRQSLLDCVIDNWSSTLCSNPRDRIYALLGIAESTLGVIPNYTATTTEVYADFLEKSIEQTQRLDFMVFFVPRVVIHSDERPAGSSWPSWIPHPDNSTNGYTFNGKAMGSSVPRVTISPDCQTLKINGNHITTVEHVIGTYPGVFRNRQTMKRELAQNLMDLIERVQGKLSALPAHQRDGSICYAMTDFGVNAGEGAEQLDWVKFGSKALQALLSILKNGIQSGLDRFDVSTEHLHEEDARLAKVLLESMRNQSCEMSITSDPSVAMTNCPAEVGDVIVSFLGGDVFYALRQEKSSAARFSFIAQARLPGMGYMWGNLIVNHNESWLEDVRKVVVRALEADHSQAGSNPLDVPETGPVEEDLPLFKRILPPMVLSAASFDVRKVPASVDLNEYFLTRSTVEQTSLIRSALLLGPMNENLTKVAPQLRKAWWDIMVKLLLNDMVSKPTWWLHLMEFEIH